MQWTNTTGQPVSAITVRVSIPDAPGGGGITATLNLYVAGAFRQTLNLNSRQSWVYEGNNHYNDSSDQNPADGNPRVFFDEVAHLHHRRSDRAPERTFALQRDAANTAAFYDIDVVDVENPAPIAQPANSISITSCGAVASTAATNGAADPQATDSTAAIQNCINQAQSQGKVLWIPAGTFYLKGTAGLHAQGITIAGAGPWYSTVYRAVPLPNSPGLGAIFDLTSCTVRDFHLDSNATSRATVDGAGGAMDTTGTNWVADNIWTQHTLSGFWASGTGGTVRNSRLTTIWADGINLNNVSLNSSVGNNLTATNNFVRGTGDDGMAINSVNYNTDSNGNRTYYTAMSHITMTHNTVIAPWGGKGIGIYGGTDQDVEAQPHHRHRPLHRPRRRPVRRQRQRPARRHRQRQRRGLRSGGNGYSQGQPALQVGNGGDGQNVGVVDRVTVTNNTVTGSLYDGIGFSTSTNTLLQNNTVTTPGRNGIVIAPPFYPAPSGSATITSNTVTGLTSGMSAIRQQLRRVHRHLERQQLAGRRPAHHRPPRRRTAAPRPRSRAPCRRRTTTPAAKASAYNVSSVNGTGNSYRADGVEPGVHLGHRRRVQRRLDRRRAVAAVHRQRRHRRHLHDQPADRRARRGHRRAAPGQRRRHQPHRRRQHPRHRRLADLDHRHHHSHPASRTAGTHPRPGQRRLEPQQSAFATGGGTNPTTSPTPTNPTPTNLAAGRPTTRVQPQPDVYGVGQRHRRQPGQLLGERQQRVPAVGPGGPGLRAVGSPGGTAAAGRLGRPQPDPDAARLQRRLDVRHGRRLDRLHVRPVGQQHRHPHLPGDHSAVLAGERHGNTGWPAAQLTEFQVWNQ